MKTMLVDSNFLAYRAKLTTGNLQYNGVATGVMFGFINQLLTCSKKIEPDKIIFTWDSKKSKRKKILPSYKEKRRENQTEEEEREWKEAFTQFNQLREEILPRIGFKNNFIQDGLESDDLIARYVFDNEHENIYIVTADDDMLQLLHKSYIYNLAKNQISSKELFEKNYEIHPSEWASVKMIAGCFDRNTEILTQRGWVYFPNLKKNDYVYSMDKETQIGDFYPVSKLICYYHSGEMYHITGSNIDMYVTPDHKFFGTVTSAYNHPNHRSKRKFKEIKEIVENYTNFTIPLTSIYEGKDPDHFELPSYNKSYYVGNRYNSNKTKTFLHRENLQIKIEDWVAFFGIWLAEGFVNKNRNGYVGEVGIAQSKKENKEQIRNLLEKLPFNWTENKNGFTTSSIQLATYLKSIGKTQNKHIPNDIKVLSPRLLKILINWMLLGDGHQREYKAAIFGQEENTYTRKCYYSTSKQLIDDLHEIVIKIGGVATINKREKRTWNIRGRSGVSNECYELNFNKSTSINLLCKKINVCSNFNDYVFDVETKPHHTILVRRNGKSVWSSNCKSDNVPGVPGVGEKTAIKYLKGDLKRTLKTYQKIKENKNTIEFNRQLVVLPFESTKSLKVVENEFDMREFLRFCRDFNLLSFRKDDKKEEIRKYFR